jgi:hypothetical protein
MLRFLYDPGLGAGVAPVVQLPFKVPIPGGQSGDDDRAGQHRVAVAAEPGDRRRSPALIRALRRPSEKAWTFPPSPRPGRVKTEGSPRVDRHGGAERRTPEAP